MSAYETLTKLIEDQGKAFEEFKKTNDERIEAQSKGNTTKATELDHKLGRIEAELKKIGDLKRDVELEMGAQKERIEELEAKRSQPGATAAEKRTQEYKQAWLGWVRNRGMDPQSESKLQDMQRKMIESKDVTIGSSAGGGYAVPEDIARTIEQLEAKYSPVRSLVKVVKTGTSDYKELVGIRGASSGWVGESGSRNATTTPQLREVTPTHGELYAYPQASEWSLDDIFFNVEEWIAQNVAEEFALQEADAVIRGNGTSKPTGMLNTAPTTADDVFPPTRAAAAYQYIESGGSPNELTGDILIDLVYKLNSAYRGNATFAFNSVTAGHIRKLKDENGVYIWQPGLVSGQPDRLLGYPISIWEQMDSVGSGAGNFPVAFGDFKRGYLLVDRVGLRMTRDNVTNVGFVRFYVRRRVGGIVLNNDSVKWIRS